ncbi:hypothetical protein A3218_25680 [Pseudomonas chlororaphis]|nr:hypothetical protein A3218_25680 [Pseudomonas chlororaphis]
MLGTRARAIFGSFVAKLSKTVNARRLALQVQAFMPLMSFMPLGDRFLGVMGELQVWGCQSISTQGARESSIRWVCSGGIGNGVSMAEAKGWISSGHSGLNSHNPEPQRLQKCRSALLRRARLPGSLSSAW